MDISNASLLDEGTAAAEAVNLVLNHSKSNTVYVADDCHPQTIGVVKVRRMFGGVPPSRERRWSAGSTSRADACGPLDSRPVSVFSFSLFARGVLAGCNRRVCLWVCCHQTRAEAMGVKVVVGPASKAGAAGKNYAGVLLQYPNTDGTVESYGACLHACVRKCRRADDVLPCAPLPVVEWVVCDVFLSVSSCAACCRRAGR